jgi:anti-sigma factor RsiW
MNCVELRKSLAEIEDGDSAVQQAHLKTCPECSALLMELNLIASSAVDLQEANEPSPRLWNSIETALRQEGLIHAPGMTCVELQHSLVEIEDARSAAQQAHLKTCPDCSALVVELNLISSSAIDLREANEPSPRVWNSIEIALRQEGLIHPPRPSRSLLPSLSSRWAWARWMAPAAAAVLIAVGVYVYPHPPAVQVVANLPRTGAPVSVSDASAAGLNDADLLQEVAQQTPAMQAQYADNLRRVNEYIQDAKNNVASDPNDEEARRSLLEAYQEKAMLFELAMDRSLQ